MGTYLQVSMVQGGITVVQDGQEIGKMKISIFGIFCNNKKSLDHTWININYAVKTILYE